MSLFSLMIESAEFKALTLLRVSCDAASYPLTATCTVGPNGKPCEGGADGATGTVSFKQDCADCPTTVAYDISGMTEGKHGFHIHEKADFSNGCKSAGPHWNPHGKTHGNLGDVVCHAGDLGNISADSAGVATGSVESSLVKLDGEFSVVGRSVMVHADADDLGQGDHSEPGTNGKTSQTTGNAGGRIACGDIVLQ